LDGEDGSGDDTSRLSAFRAGSVIDVAQPRSLDGPECAVERAIPTPPSTPPLGGPCISDTHTPSHSLDSFKAGVAVEFSQPASLDGPESAQHREEPTGGSDLGLEERRRRVSELEALVRQEQSRDPHPS